MIAWNQPDLHAWRTAIVWPGVIKHCLYFGIGIRLDNYKCWRVYFFRGVFPKKKHTVVHCLGPCHRIIPVFLCNSVCLSWVRKELSGAVYLPRRYLDPPKCTDQTPFTSGGMTGCLGDVRNTTTCQQGTKNPTNRKYWNGGMAMAGLEQMACKVTHTIHVWHNYRRLLIHMGNVLVSIPYMDGMSTGYEIGSHRKSVIWN